MDDIWVCVPKSGHICYHNNQITMVQWFTRSQEKQNNTRKERRSTIMNSGFRKQINIKRMTKRSLDY